jgi:O-antigen ligase
LRNVALVALVGGAVLMFAPAQFWERQATTLTYESDASAMGRIHAWGVALNIGIERPLGGVGGGAFRHAWALYAPPGSGSYAYVAHNLFLEILGEYGIFGLGFFAGFTYLTLRGAWRVARDPSCPQHAEARAVLAGAVGLLVCQMTSGFKISTGLYLACALAAVVDRLALWRSAKALREEALA